MRGVFAEATSREQRTKFRVIFNNTIAEASCGMLPGGLKVSRCQKKLTGTRQRRYQFGGDAAATRRGWNRQSPQSASLPSVAP